MQYNIPMINPTNWFRCSQGCTCMFSPPVACYCGVVPGHEQAPGRSGASWDHRFLNQLTWGAGQERYNIALLCWWPLLVTTSSFIFISKMVYRSLDYRKFQVQCWQCLVHDRNKNDIIPATYFPCVHYVYRIFHKSYTMVAFTLFIFWYVTHMVSKHYNLLQIWS